MGQHEARARKWGMDGATTALARKEGLDGQGWAGGEAQGQGQVMGRQKVPRGRDLVGPKERGPGKVMGPKGQGQGQEMGPKE